LNKIEEEKRKNEEKEARIKAAEEKKRKVEQEARIKAAEEKKRREEQEARIRAAEEKQRKEEQEKRKLKEDEQRIQHESIDEERQMALELNKEGLAIYREGKLSENQKKFALAIKRYKEAKEKFEKAHLIKALDEIFASLLLVLEGFLKTEAYHDASNTVLFMEKGYRNKSDVVKGLKEAIDHLKQKRWTIDY
jgi:membrane protein involved in colicin uptake